MHRTTRTLSLATAALVGATAFPGAVAHADGTPPDHRILPPDHGYAPPGDPAWDASSSPAPLQFPATTPEIDPGPTNAASTVPFDRSAMPPAGDRAWNPASSPAPMQLPARRPEIDPRIDLSPEDAADAAVATAGDCPTLRYCAWTGGYFTGPMISFVVGYAYDWGNYAEPACSSSGDSGAIWKNCASSLRNRNAVYTAHFFTGGSGSGAHLTVAPGSSRDQLGGFNDNVESSVA